MLAFALGGQISRGALGVAAAGFPGLVLGSYVGEHGFRRLDAETFRRIVFVMLLLSGMVSLVGALVS